MSNIDKQALRDIAESIEREEWEVLDNGDDEYQVIVKGSLEKWETYRSYQPVSNEISERKIATFIAAFGPATVLALLDELEDAEKRIAELEAKLETADKLQDSAFRHGLQHGFSLGQTDNQDGFEECLSAYGTRVKDNG